MKKGQIMPFQTTCWKKGLSAKGWVQRAGCKGQCAKEINDVEGPGTFDERVA